MATRSPNGVPQRVGYEALRECRKKAYGYLAEAVKIDEEGIGKDSQCHDAGKTVLLDKQQWASEILLP